MASCQERGGRFQFRISAKGILERPVFFTFDDREEGERYVARLESLIRQGIVPPELIEKNREFVVIGDLIRGYQKAVPITEEDGDLLNVQFERIGTVRLGEVSYQWAEKWIAEMKRVRNLAPSTIRHHVGALARCFDWASNRGVPEVAVNPLRLLPRGYSTYTSADKKVLSKEGKEGRIDEWRDRRLEDGEEAAIRSILNGDKPKGRERSFALEWQGALECLFELALETAMRMREIYTLTVDQVDFPKRTIFLEKTKNGNKRQVPMSSTAVQRLQNYIKQVENGERKMAGFSFKDDRLFPWWNGISTQKELRKVTNRLSHQFSDIFSAAGAESFRFHDLRHEATSRFFERTAMSEGEIMKITGHSSAEMLLRYANLRGSNLAEKLW